MKKYIVLFTTILSFQAQALICATSEKIEGMDPAEAIKMAYASGPSAGNFAFEWEFDGLVYMSKENAQGNEAMLEMYPVFNQMLVDAQGDQHYSHDNDYNGIFQITYDQVRQCRRQVLITGVKYHQGNQKNVFTGWINVELCDPNLQFLFKKGAEYWEGVKGEKMDNILKLLEFVDLMHAQGKIDDDRLQAIKMNLDPAGAIENLHWNTGQQNAPDPYINNGDHGVYYVLGNNGNIIPRFSLRIENLEFEEYEDTCGMNINPTVAYSGVLKPERHSFSNSLQSQAFETASQQKKEVDKGEFVVYWWDHITGEDKQSTDPKDWNQKDNGYSGPNFYLSNFTQTGENQFRPAVINRTLNNDPEYRLITSFKAGYLNIRSETNSSGGENTVCGIFKSNDTVKVIDRATDGTDWLLVEVPASVKKRDGSSNTCSGKSWITNKEAFSTPAFRRITAYPDLNVRFNKETSNKSEVCGAYGSGTIVKLIAIDLETEWMQVEIQDGLTKTDGSAHTCNSANDSDGKFWMSSKPKYSTPVSAR